MQEICTFHVLYSINFLQEDWIASFTGLSARRCTKVKHTPHSQDPNEYTVLCLPQHNQRANLLLFQCLFMYSIDEEKATACTGRASLPMSVETSMNREHHIGIASSQ